MADLFADYHPGIESPAPNIQIVTPSDSVDIPTSSSRGISFGGAGDLAVLTVGGQTVTIPNGALAAGIIHPLRIKRVLATGTTATNILSYH